MSLSLGLLIFATDAITAYMGGKYLDARLARRIGRTLLWDGALALVVGINLLGFISLSWVALPWSIAGSLLGTALSFVGDHE